MSEVKEQGETGSVEPGVERLSPRTYERVNRWLSLGANFGVLLGLILLIVEVRQTATLTHTSIEVGTNDALSAIEFSLATPHSIDAWVKSVREPHSMTDMDIRLVEAHLVAVMQQWETLFDMEKARLVKRARVTSHISNKGSMKI